nr:OmpA family protein [Loktanella sp. SALINAS62]
MTDDGEGCSGRWPGADIDAVAAIGTPERFVLEGVVLFEFDSATLRGDAREALSETLQALQSREFDALWVIGNTDSKGSASYNQKLSEARATAVRNWLAQQSAFSDVSLFTEGAGETAPTADNATDVGRQRNRRVEIIAVPAR